MTISSRTPEGFPSHCPLCGASTSIDYSSQTRDAPCPNCGCLLWASAQAVDSLTKQIEAALAVSGGSISADTNFSDLGIDSLDMVEMVMEIEEEFDISIPDEDATPIQTVGEAVRYIVDRRRRTNG